MENPMHRESENTVRPKLSPTKNLKDKMTFSHYNHGMKSSRIKNLKSQIEGADMITFLWRKGKQNSFKTQIFNDSLWKQRK